MNKFIHAVTGDKQIRVRSLPPAFVLVVATLNFSNSALAGHQPGTVLSYTGCLTVNGTNTGTLTAIAEGDSPKKPCNSNQVEAHFSGGDVTSISAGTGLVGGGSTGGLALSLDPKYALPQSCSNGQVAKWGGNGWNCADDNDSTYTAGAGLDLANNQFSIKSGFQLPQTCSGGQSPQYSVSGWQCQDFALANSICPSGQIANGIDASGRLLCVQAGPIGGLQTFTGTSASSQPVGVPDSGSPTKIVSVNVPAGTYFVTAKLVITSSQGVSLSGFTFAVTCAVAGDVTKLGERAFPDATEIPVALAGVVNTPGGEIALSCTAFDGADGIESADPRIVAVKLN